MSSPLADVAKFYAALQAVGGCLGGLFSLVVFSSRAAPYEGLLLLGCAVFVTAVAIGYLCRVNAARLFLAGEFVMGTLALAIGLLVTVTTADGCLIVVLAITLGFAVLGAFAYVSKGSREYCGR
jgi:hypothetical protein